MQRRLSESSIFTKSNGSLTMKLTIHIKNSSEAKENKVITKSVNVDITLGEIRDLIKTEGIQPDIQALQLMCDKDKKIIYRSIYDSMPFRNVCELRAGKVLPEFEFEVSKNANKKFHMPSESETSEVEFFNSLPWKQQICRFM